MPVRARVLRRVALGATIAVVLVLGISGMAYGSAYGTLAWWRDPERIPWCGREYNRSETPVLTRSEVEQRREALPGDLPYPMVEVTKVPPLIGHRVLASVTPGATGGRFHLPCAGALYLQTGPDSYQAYLLGGGP
jgi:hypothetical protein